jgi:hypothetical protein
MENVENAGPTDEEIINAGNECESLLNNETFTKVMNNLIDGAVRNFLTSETDAGDKREAAYAATRAINDIVSTLNHQVTVRDQLLQKDVETAEEE